MLAASIGAGLAEMSAVSAAIKQLKRDENARLSARMDRQKRQVDLLTLGLALAMVIGTLTLAVIFRYMDRLWKARARAEAAATHLAHHDALTGLPNRRLLTDRLNMGIAHARRHGRCVALLCLDLDGFKRVNDTQGHDAGDELLRQVANRLRTVLRGEDTIARTGGDEFVITLGDLDDSSQAQSVAEKIIRAMSIPFTLGDAEATIGTSVGIALYPLHGDTEQALLKSGDAALYRAKAKGKSRYELAGAP